MALTPVRKWLNAFFGVLLLAFLGSLLWPLLSRPFALRSFCGELQSGISIGAVRGLADQHGFKVSSSNDGTVHVYDYQSLGKFSCTLRMQGDKVVDAGFEFAD